MGDDDRVPVRGRGARQEPGALLLDEIGLVGDQDAGGRVELQELARACARQWPGTTSIALLIRPSRFCSMIAAAIENVLPAPTAWAM